LKYSSKFSRAPVIAMSRSEQALVDLAQRDAELD
jgi:hypothetical protein